MGTVFVGASARTITSRSSSVARSAGVVLGELVLVGKRRELLLVDEAALGGLLNEALGRREVVQMNRVAQWNPFRCGGAACGAASLRPCAVLPAIASPYVSL